MLVYQRVDPPQTQDGTLQGQNLKNPPMDQGLERLPFSLRVLLQSFSKIRQTSIGM